MLSKPHLIMVPYSLRCSLHADLFKHFGPCRDTGAHPSVVTQGGRRTKRVGEQQPGQPRPPTPQEACQRLKVRAVRSVQEVEDEAQGFLDTTRDAIQWRRNQQVWIRLLVQGPSRMMLETVTTYGAPEPMTHQELFALMVAFCWMLK